MKIAVTGASGFLGGHIAEHFINAGHEVVSLLRPSSDASSLDQLIEGHTIERGLLSDLNFLCSVLKGVDVLVHSAARVKEEGSRQQFYDENVILTENLLNIAKEQGVKRFIFISSPSVVSALEHQINIDESHPYPKKFLNYYCETKAIAEQKVLAAASDDFICCSLRPRCIWGPRDQSGPVKQLLQKLHAGEMRDLSYGEAAESSMCYVGNAAAACVMASQSSGVNGNVYFVTDEEVVNTWEHLSYMSEYFSLPGCKPAPPKWLLMFVVGMIDWLWKIPYLRNNVPPPISSYGIGLLSYSASYTIAAAKKDFNYLPEYSLDQGLEAYAQWIESIGGIDRYLSD